MPRDHADPGRRIGRWRMTTPRGDRNARARVPSGKAPARPRRDRRAPPGIPRDRIRRLVTGFMIVPSRPRSDRQALERAALAHRRMPSALWFLVAQALSSVTWNGKERSVIRWPKSGRRVATPADQKPRSSGPGPGPSHRHRMIARHSKRREDFRDTEPFRDTLARTERRSRHAARAPPRRRR